MFCRLQQLFFAPRGKQSSRRGAASGSRKVFRPMVEALEARELLTAKDGFLPVQRSVQAPVQDYAWPPDITV
jgi:hypothetical protein